MVAALAAGVGLSVLGGLLGKKAAKREAKLKQQALDAQTVIDSAEFDKRDSATKAGYAATDKLRGGELDATMGIRRRSFDDLLNNDQRYSAGKADTRLAGERDIGRIRGGTDATRVSALLDRGQVSRGEQGRQGEIDTASRGTFSAALPQMGVDKFNENRAGAAGTRVQDVTNALTAADAAPVANTGGKFAQALAGENAKVMGVVRAGAEGRAGSDAYGDAVSSNDRVLSGVGERLGLLQDKSDLSLNAYDSEKAAGVLKGDNAVEASDQRRAAVQKKVSDYLEILENERARKALTKATKYGNEADATGQYFGGQIDAENALMNALIGSSGQYQDTTSALTQYKIGGTKVSSTLGNILSQVGGSLTGAGMSGIADKLNAVKLSSLLKSRGAVGR